MSFRINIIVGMNGAEKENRFRLWSGAMYGDPQGLTICLEKID